MKNAISLIFLVSMILLVHADLSGATSGNINGSSAIACRGSVDCLIGEEFDAAEFPIHSHIGRMLFDFSRATTGITPRRNLASVDCPLRQGYRNCLPTPNGGPKQRCGDYTRKC